MSTQPVPIGTGFDPDIPAKPGYEFGDRRLVVNRADRGDGNVVLSFQDNKGQRDAIGIPPSEAIKLAAAVLAAVNAINGGE